jgi:hypothetical protein
MLTLTLGAVELANIIYTYQVMHHLVSQGASMASRIIPPTTPTDLLNKVIDAACPLISQGSPPPANCPPSNASIWRVIYTEIGPDTATPPNYVVRSQLVAGLGPVQSDKRICPNCGLSTISCDPTVDSCLTPTNIPNIANIGSGQSLFAFEVFYSYSPITVLGNFVGGSFSGDFYERSIF